VPCGNGLLGALAYFGLGGMDAVEKEEMRNLAIRGGPWSPEEKIALINYCEADVVALGSLFERMK
jgi:DNA polymerase-1